MRQVVVAWVELHGDVEAIPGEWERFDGVNYRPKLRRIHKAHAAMWANEGTGEDAQKALAWLEKDRPGDYRSVYSYDPREADPLGKARQDVLQSYYLDHLSEHLGPKHNHVARCVQGACGP